MDVLVTCKYEDQRTNGPVNAHLISGPRDSKSTKQTKPGNKYEKDLINNSGEKCFPIISLWGFFSGTQGQLTHRSRWSDLAKFRTTPSSHAYHYHLQV